MRCELVCVFFFGLLASPMLSQRLSPEEVHKQLNKFNYGRGVIAMTRNIGNMWKLEWDEELVSIALDMTKVCPDVKPGANYRYFFANPDKEAMLFETTMEKKLLAVPRASQIIARNKWLDATTMYALEFWLPLQKSVGCIDYECHRDLSISYKKFSANWRRLCIIGPVAVASTSFVATEKAPASACGPDGKAEGPLCGVVVFGLFANLVSADHLRAVIGSAVMLKGPPMGMSSLVRQKRDIVTEFPIKDTLARLNNVRRQTAKIGKIANMWALEWSEKLVEKARKMPKECEKVHLGTDYRFFFTGGDPTTLMYEVAQFHGIHADPADPTTSALLRRMEKEGGSQVEVMHPLQKHVGCVPYECRRSVWSEYHEETMDIHHTVLCLTGPFGVNEPRDIVLLGEPGSVCDHGTNKDGLCVN